MKIERPDKDGNGCSLDCGVSFVHTHPTGERKKPVPYKDTETTNQFIESQQELARDTLIQSDASGFANLSDSEVDEIIAQIIQNTGEELMRRAEGEKAIHNQLANEWTGISLNGSQARINPHLSQVAAIDTLKKQIASVTGVE